MLKECYLFVIDMFLIRSKIVKAVLPRFKNGLE